MSKSTDQEIRNTKVCERFINEVWNKNNLDVAREIVTSDFIFHLNNEKFATTGPESLLPLIIEVVNSNESFEIKVEDVFAKNEKIAVRWISRGKNKIHGVETVNNGVFVMHFRSGKISECWQIIDMLSHYQKLGFQLSPPDDSGKQDKETVGVLVYVVRVVDSVGQFLFLRRSGGTHKNQWWPVAGKIETGEDPVQAALRELKEETGLIPLEMHKLGMYVPPIDRKSKLEGLVAFVEPNSMVKLNYEHSEFCWYGEQEAIESLHPSAIPIIRYIESRFLNSLPPKDSRLWPPLI